MVIDTWQALLIFAAIWGVFYLIAKVAGRKTAKPAEAKDDILRDLLPWVRGEVLVTGDSFPKKAAETIRANGAAGATVLAKLIEELLHCRTAGIVWALAVAEELDPSPSLVEAVRAVVVAPGLRLGSTGRFAPKIIGRGQIGWSDSTEARVKRNARHALGRLTSRSPALTPSTEVGVQVAQSTGPPTITATCPTCGKVHSATLRSHLAEKTVVCSCGSLVTLRQASALR